MDTLEINRLERFSKLCKPLKDLALNWEVDIAEELDEYLIDLGRVATGSKNLNYAQVAMVIQGSANVYSKKVEFLHGLVYKHLDFLLSTKSHGTKKKAQGPRGKHKTTKLLDSKHKNYETIKDVIARKKTSSKLDSDILNESSSVLLGAYSSNVNRLSGNVLNTLAYPFFEGGCLKTSEFSNEEAFDGNEDADGKKILSHIYSLVNTDEHESFFEGASIVEDKNSTPVFKDNTAMSDSGFDFDSFGDANSEKGSTIVENDNNHTDIFSMLYSRERLDTNHKQTARPFRKATFSIRKKIKKVDAFERRLYRKRDEWQGWAGDSSRESSVHLLNTIGQAIRTTSSVEKFRRKINSGSLIFLDKERIGRLLSLKKKVLAKYSREVSSPEVAESVFSDDGFEDIHQEQESIGINQNLDLSVNVFDDHSKENLVEFEEYTDAYPESYLDMVKSHVQKYLSRAKKWAKESNIEEIVRNWQDRLQPILEEQAEHPEFDIHKYGKRVLKSLDKLNCTDSFEHVVNNQTSQRYEACRLFLATLQLANNGNVELQHTSNYARLNIKLLDEITMNEKIGDNLH